MQTFTFYASEDKLENRGNYVAEKISVSKTLFWWTYEINGLISTDLVERLSSAFTVYHNSFGYI